MTAGRKVSVYGVILAAGASKRMGRPKQLLPVGDSTMLETVMDSMLGGGLDGLAVVTNDIVEQTLKLTKRSEFTTRIMPDPEVEMLESVLAGFDAIQSKYSPSDSDAILICPGDMPRIDASLISRVSEKYRSTSGRIVVAAVGQKPGHPIVIPFHLRPQIENLRGIGLKGLLSNPNVDIVQVQADHPNQMTDVDTPSDYQSLEG